jgi:molybdopterin synthase catalytic subunit
LTASSSILVTTELQHEAGEASVFDINERIERIKAQPDADGIGMILAHQGIVRGASRAGEPVHGMHLEVDRRRLDQALAEALDWPGVVAVDGWVNEGDLEVGDDIMKVVVAGDFREHVFGALQRLVGIIKSEVVTESEFR